MAGQSEPNQPSTSLSGPCLSHDVIKYYKYKYKYEIDTNTYI